VWIWVPKGGALAAVELGLGFSARQEKIRRYDGSSRRLVRVANKQINNRTFAEVVSTEPSRSFGQNIMGGVHRTWVIELAQGDSMRSVASRGEKVTFETGIEWVKI
jgi:hypothetical protein